MRQAIVTKYFGPSNSRGARVKAIAEAGSIMLPWDHALSASDNHYEAAKALCKKMHWSFSRLVSGGLPDGTQCWLLFDRDGFATGAIKE